MGSFSCALYSFSVFIFSMKVLIIHPNNNNTLFPYWLIAYILLAKDSNWIYPNFPTNAYMKNHKCNRIVSTWIVDFQTSTGRYDPRLVMAWLSRSKATAWTSHKLLHLGTLFTTSAVQPCLMIEFDEGNIADWDPAITESKNFESWISSAGKNLRCCKQTTCLQKKIDNWSFP